MHLDPCPGQHEPEKAARRSQLAIFKGLGTGRGNRKQEVRHGTPEAAERRAELAAIARRGTESTERRNQNYVTNSQFGDRSVGTGD